MSVERLHFEIEVHNLQGSESVSVTLPATDKLAALLAAAEPIETEWQVDVWDPSIGGHLTYRVMATNYQHALSVVAADIQARSQV